MKRKYAIAIPSRGRADWLRKQNRSTLKQIAFLKPDFWIRDDESEETYQSYAHYMLECGVRPSDWMRRYNGKGILGAAQTYDYLIDYYIAEGFERLLILDDDLAFTMHNPIPNAKPDFKICDEYETETLFNHITNLVCPQMPMMSFTPIMTRSHPHLIAYCKPMMMAYSYYLPHFAKHPEHRFWFGENIEARCDLNLSLKMLTEGFLNGFLVSCFIPDNVNNPGGCSIYRDLEMETKSVEYLMAQYPMSTKPRMKKGWVGDPNVMRKAVTIQWKRAFDHGKFFNNFNEDATVFAHQHLLKYEIIYADFIRGIREQHDGA